MWFETIWYRNEIDTRKNLEKFRNHFSFLSHYEKLVTNSVCLHFYSKTPDPMMFFESVPDFSEFRFHFYTILFKTKSYYE